jgi:hypothetical protein
VHEHVFAAFIALDEAEALAAVEKLDRAGAFANDLRRHAATAATARAAEAATTAAAATRAAEAAAITTAETTAASTAAAAAEAITTAAETIAATAETVAATAGKRIKALFAETVPLVAAPAATSSIKTHKPE